MRVKNQCMREKKKLNLPHMHHSSCRYHCSFIKSNGVWSISDVIVTARPRWKIKTSKNSLDQNTCLCSTSYTMPTRQYIFSWERPISQVHPIYIYIQHTYILPRAILYKQLSLYVLTVMLFEKFKAFFHFYKCYNYQLRTEKEEK